MITLTCECCTRLLEKQLTRLEDKEFVVLIVIKLLVRLVVRIIATLAIVQVGHHH